MCCVENDLVFNSTLPSCQVYHYDTVWLLSYLRAVSLHLELLSRPDWIYLAGTMAGVLKLVDTVLSLVLLAQYLH